MTHGRFPMTGVSGLAPSLDSHGMFATTVADVALAWSALTDSPEASQDSPPRLLVWPGNPTPAMATALANAQTHLTAAGATVTTFPATKMIEALTSAHKVVMAYEAARTIPPGPVSEQLQDLLTTGAAIPPENYKAALKTITEAELPDAYDAVLCPGAPGPAPAGLASTGDPVMSRPWQALGLPAVAVPGHQDEVGLPLGLQLVGHTNEETALLATACWVEATLTQ